MPIFEIARSESYYAAAIDNKHQVGAISGSIMRGLLIIIDIQIEQNSRRNGWGGQLYDALENWGISHSATALIGQFNPEPGYEIEARKFYESHGISIDPSGRMYKKLGQNSY